MNCEEYLSIIETASLGEIEQNTRLRQHAASCEDCSRVIRLIAEGEHDLAMALDNVSSSIPASQTAEAAIVIAKRRRVGRLFAGLFVVLIAITAWITWVQLIVPSMRATVEIAAGNLRTETIPLQCLSPNQVGDLISPYVRSSGSAYYPAKAPMTVITVRATPEEIQKVKALLDQFDKPGTTGCAVPNSPGDRPR